MAQCINKSRPSCSVSKFRSSSFLGIKWIDEKIKEKKTTQQPKLDNTGILSRISDHIAPSSMAT